MEFYQHERQKTSNLAFYIQRHRASFCCLDETLDGKPQERGKGCLYGALLERNLNNNPAFGIQVKVMATHSVASTKSWMEDNKEVEMLLISCGS